MGAEFLVYDYCRRCRGKEPGEGDIVNAYDKVVVLITTSSGDEARSIADALIGNRKAACVNIVSGIDSRYWWQGKIDSEDENLLIVKTKASFIDEVISLVKGIHSYEVPEIIALPIIAGNEDYLGWIEEEAWG
ncbi:divalent-cation tolerance protein CutA [Chloroflexota bacterium]